MSQNWEFTYVDLYMGIGDVSSVHARQREITELGRAGWEPVGEIRFDFTERGYSASAPATQARQLMFKRRAS